MCLFLDRVLGLILPYWQGSIISTIQDYVQAVSKNEDSKLPQIQSHFQTLIYFYLFTSIAEAVFSASRSYTVEVTLRKLSASIRKKLYSAVVRMDIFFFDAAHTGNLTSRLLNDVAQAVNPMQTLINELLANFITLIGSSFLLFFTAPKLAVLAMTVVPPIGFFF